MSPEDKKYTFKEMQAAANRQKAQETYKLRLWTNRAAFVRKANLCMRNKMYTEAVLAYEKYLKILEIIYDCGPDGLNPQLFRSGGRTAELSIIANCYWDLLRLYDSTGEHLDRQRKVAEQLAKFVVYTPMYMDIIRKAQAFQRQSKQPEVIKDFVHKVTKSRSMCFIATSVYESPLAIEVQTLRNFRDHVLAESYLGRQFIYCYYKVSPSVAHFLENHPAYKKPMKIVLEKIVNFIS